MRVKLQHRFRIFPYIGIAAIFLILVFGTLIKGEELKGLRDTLIDISSVIAVVFFIISLVMAFAKTTTVTIEQGMLKIKYPIGERELPVNSITALTYNRRARVSGGRGVSTTIYRSELVIETRQEGETCTISLNDNATSDKNTRLPDDEVPLYSIYYCLKDLTGIDGIEADRNQWDEGFWGYIIHKSIDKK